MAAAKTGLNFVPEADLERFTSPPAQVDDAALAQARKVDQPTANIAHDDAHALDAFDHQPKLAGHRSTPRVVHFADRIQVHAPICPGLPLCGLGCLLRAGQRFDELVRFGQQPSDLRQEGFRLRAGKGPWLRLHEGGL